MLEKQPPYKNYRPKNYPDQLWNTREDGTLDVAHINEQPSLTQQQFKDECDINNIMKSYQETGTINHLNPRPGIFTEFHELPANDFQEAMEIVAYAKSAFADLPAKIRSRFENDPQKLVEFCNNSNNLEEAIELGLAIKSDSNAITPNPKPTNANTSPVPKPSKKSAVIPPEPTSSDE